MRSAGLILSWRPQANLKGSGICRSNGQTFSADTQDRESRFGVLLFQSNRRAPTTRALSDRRTLRQCIKRPKHTASRLQQSVTVRCPKAIGVMPFTPMAGSCGAFDRSQKTHCKAPAQAVVHQSRRPHRSGCQSVVTRHRYAARYTSAQPGNRENYPARRRRRVQSGVRFVTLQIEPLEQRLQLLQR